MTRYGGRVLGRARHELYQARRGVGELRSVRRSVLGFPADQRPPRPSGFAAFGEGSWVVPPARVRNPGRIAIGCGAVVLEHSTLHVFDDATPEDGALLVLGDDVVLARFTTVHCEVGVVIGDGVACSDGVTITDTWRLPPGITGPSGTVQAAVPLPAPVVVGPGAYLGFGCSIGPGVHIGAGAYVGELATVWGDVPAHAVVTGNPARVISWLDRSTGLREGTRWP